MIKMIEMIKMIKLCKGFNSKKTIAIPYYEWVTVL